MDNRSKYRELCATEPSIPIFSRDWWLDAVAGEKAWDVVTVESNDRIIGALPYHMRKVAMFRIICMPRQTQKMGVWLKYPEGQKYTNRLAFEKKVVTELIDKLPPFHRFHQTFDHSLTNWLPFYWKGFRQTTRYTYCIDDLSDLEKIHSDFRENIRREIRKAQKQVVIEESQNSRTFYDLNAHTFERQGLSIPYSFDFFRTLDAACSVHKCRKIFIARDEKEAIHAAIYIVWDERSAYYLMGGSDPVYRNSGATSLLMWHAIQFAAKVTGRFDFEGSMLEYVEKYFRAFGAKQVPYFSITKSSKLFDALFSQEKFVRTIEGIIKK